MTVPLLDTHAGVWWIDGDSRLARSARDFLDALPVHTRPYLADISLWEVAMLVERGRLTFQMPLVEWLEAAAHPRSVRLIPIGPAIAAEVAALPKTFHRDPVDRVIVATCRTMELPIVTRDRRILRSRLVSRWRPSPQG